MSQILGKSSFGLWKAWCQILTLTPDIVAEVYYALPQFLQVNVRLVPRIRRQLLSSTLSGFLFPKHSTTRIFKV